METREDERGTRRRQADAVARLEGLVREPGEPTPWRRASPGRAALLLALFALVLGLVEAGFGALVERVPEVRLDEGSYHRSKLVYFDAHRDEFDVVFVGSSQVWRQIAPRAFDQELARMGRPIASFNLGLPGMTFAETQHTALWVLGRRPARLRWLVLELRPVLPRLHPENDLTRRQIQWHSPAAVGLAARALLESDRGPWAKATGLARHLRHLAYRQGHVALGLPWLARVLGRTGDVDPASLRADGWDPIDVAARTDPELQARRREFLASVGELPERLRELRAQEPRAALPHELAALERLVARIRAHGVEPVFLISGPAWDRQSEFLDAQRRGAIPALLAYHDPDRFPEHYDPRNLFDFGHLASGGALAYTRRLARDFAALVLTPPR